MATVTKKASKPAYNAGDSLFYADQYLPTDPFSVSSSVPAISESEYKQRLEHIKGQLRSVEIAQQNMILAKQLYRAEGYGIEAHNETLKNQIKSQDGLTIGVQLNQARVHTQIEEVKLTELGHDLSGYQAQAGLKGDTWNLKLEGLRLDLDKAKILLNQKKEELKMLQG